MNIDKDRRMKYDAAARELVSRMTLAEKVYLMSGRTSLETVKEWKKRGIHFNRNPFPAGGNERLGIPELRFCDGPRGVVCGNRQATCFPVPVMRGASFDTELEEEIGRAVGREARAAGANFFGGVCINLAYHPGWGRSQEVYGEDSFLIGALGSAMVRGVQSEQVVACVKHYAFNSMENSRFDLDIDCDARTEREVYLPHFKECVDAGAAAVMTAFNKYRGELCGHSEYLIRGILKNEWGFDGIVISDFFWGIKDTVKAAGAGVDVEMSHTYCYGTKLIKAVEKGDVDEKLIDDAAVRIVRTLTAFEDEYKKSGKNYGREVSGCDAHAAPALRSAQEGITLIKNEGRVLPLSSKLKTIAVIGRLAAVANIGDMGSSRLYPKHVVTLLTGIIQSAGGANVVYYGGTNAAHAKRLAAGSDAVIFVVGLDYRDEGEFDPIKAADVLGNECKLRGGDRATLSLHPEETELLKAAGGVNPKTAVVMMGGGTITVSEWEDAVPAIMYAYYPGQEGGTAVGQALFGEICPCGKLPFVIPKSEQDLPEIDWNTDKQWYGYYHGYAWLDKKGIEPYRHFGYGLSYTSFRLSGAAFSLTEGGVKASVEVKNTGRRTGAEVVQLYAGFSNSAFDRPVRQLCGFKRIELKPKESVPVEIFCPFDRLEYYNEEAGGFELEHMKYEFYIGTSSDPGDLKKGGLLI